MPRLSRTQIVRYAGASGDFNPIHHDEKFAIRAGNETVFAHGMLSMGLMGKMLTDWVGDGNLRYFRLRFVNRVWPLDTVTYRAVVTDKREENGESIIVADLYAENQYGIRTVEGSMRAALPRRP
ncbi:MAG: MaoC-like dehydratase [Candidatus Tectimicrobiota bacterium]|nr:MAG: MaoC-like dehydratase [Candidatus Tectomicrobia bacterium]